MTKKEQYEATNKRYLGILLEAYERISKGEVISPKAISDKHQVTRSFFAVATNIGIIESVGRRGFYRWQAAKPTLTMANKMRLSVGEYNNHLRRERNSNESKQIQIPLYAERVVSPPATLEVKKEKRPFLLVKIGRLEIKF